MKVAIPDLISPSYFPLVAAVELGFLDAELELLYPVTKTYEELRDGRLDFVGGAAHAALYAFKDWQGGRLLCALAQHMYWFLVVRSDLKARKRDLSAVRGLRIGAAPGPVDGLKQLLQRAGIDPAEGRANRPGTRRHREDRLFRPHGGESARGRQTRWLLGKRHGRGGGGAQRNRHGFARCAPGWFRGSEGLYLSRARCDAEDDPRTSRSGAQRGQRRHGGTGCAQEEPERATAVGRKLFPPTEASLIAELIRRDAPFYDPTISRRSVEAMNRFARDMGLLSRDVAYEDVVWKG